MTFYQSQVNKLNRLLYKEYLCDQVVKGKKFIDRNFSKPIDLNQIASEAALSKFHFLRLFKKIYGITPYQYVKELRISHAKKLLQKTSRIESVSLEVGFESSTSFAGLFKKMTGNTPSGYAALQSK